MKKAFVLKHKEDGGDLLLCENSEGKMIICCKKCFDSWDMRLLGKRIPVFDDFIRWDKRENNKKNQK